MEIRYNACLEVLVVSLVKPCKVGMGRPNAKMENSRQGRRGDCFDI
jgi:hypothetical protein